MSARLLFALCCAIVASPCIAADQIRIGFLTTLSGPGAALGIDIRDGFNLGLQHAGGRLGGLPVDLRIVDDQQNPDVARQAVDRFLKQQKADVITGIVFSNVLLPVVQGILQADTFYLSPNTGPQEFAGDKCNPYFFVTSWQNEDIPGAMGRFATERGYKNVFLIAPNYPGGRESIAGFKREYKGAIADEVYTRLGQLDYSAELATLRAAAADAAFMFLPGGTGIAFIKQFGSAGLNRKVQLLVPGFSADEDTITAVGGMLIGAYNAAQWAHDLANPQNRRFVTDFRKQYGRIPSMYAAQGYDTALLIDGAVRETKGGIEDKAAFRKALEAAKFNSVRGAFRFNTNHYPIQTIYLREVIKDAEGRITNRLVRPLAEAHQDAYAGQCRMRE